MTTSPGREAREGLSLPPGPTQARNAPNACRQARSGQVDARLPLTHPARCRGPVDAKARAAGAHAKVSPGDMVVAGHLGARGEDGGARRRMEDARRRASPRVLLTRLLRSRSAAQRSD